MVAVLVGVGLLVGSSLLPRDTVNANIAADATVLRDETNERVWLGKGYLLDNNMDALMLNTAVIPAHDAVEAALLASHYASDGSAPEALVERVRLGLEPNATYERYWHGYTPVLRVAMLVMTYSWWRLINAALLVGLLLTAVGLAWRNLGIVPALAVVGVALLVAPTAIGPSLQYASVAYLALGGTIAVTLLAPRFEPSTYDLELFAAIGALTAYFDLLTAPLLTLSLPLLVLVLAPRGDRLRSALRATAAWAGAFGAFWAAKWVIGQVLWGGVFADIVYNVGYRTGATGSTATDLSGRWWSILVNQFYHVPMWLWPADPTPRNATLTLVGLLLVAVAVWVGFALWKGVRPGAWRHCAPLFVVALAPYAWLFVLSEHSTTHSYMTFRILAVVPVALAIAGWGSIDWRGTRGGSPTSGGGDHGEA